MTKNEMWMAMVERFMGREWIIHAKSFPSYPTMPTQVGDVELEKVTEEERFLYSILPSSTNYDCGWGATIATIETLWDVWWLLVTSNHRLCGEIGVRKGWVLVQPPPNKMQVIRGEFRMKDGRGVMN